MERCPGYVGYTCVNGSCPKANADEYAERGYDITHSCDECGWYKGCEDCALKDTEHCVKNTPKPTPTPTPKPKPTPKPTSRSGKKHIKDSTELSGGHLW